MKPGTENGTGETFARIDINAGPQLPNKGQDTPATNGHVQKPQDTLLGGVAASQHGGMSTISNIMAWTAWVMLMAYCSTFAFFTIISLLWDHHE